MKHVGMFEAKTRLSALVEEVEKGGQVVITRHGKPVVELVRAVPKLTAEQIAARRQAFRAIREGAKFPNIGSLSELAEDSLAAPSHWPAELGNALVSNVRRRRLARDEIARLMDQIERMGVEILPPPSPAETALIAEQALDLGLTFTMR